MYAGQADIGQLETRKRKETLFKISYMVEVGLEPKWKYSIYRQKQIGTLYAIQSALLAI